MRSTLPPIPPAWPGAQDLRVQLSEPVHLERGVDGDEAASTGECVEAVGVEPVQQLHSRVTVDPSVEVRRPQNLPDDGGGTIGDAVTRLDQRAAGIREDRGQDQV